jgi:hypothetical protein
LVLVVLAVLVTHLVLVDKVMIRFLRLLLQAVGEKVAPIKLLMAQLAAQVVEVHQVSMVMLEPLIKVTQVVTELLVIIQTAQVAVVPVVLAQMVAA